MLTACDKSESNNKSDSSNAKTSAGSKLQIVSTIKPIQAIVVAIAGKQAQSEQLIPDYASPHNYSFKPSDIRKVKSADVIFRIDEHMETQLNDVFDSLENNAKVVSLAEAEGINLLESDGSHEDHESETSEHKGEHEEEDVHGHDEHENIDFHIWTSPKNAIHMANEVSKTLIELNPENKQYYQENLKVFNDTIQLEFEESQSRLEKYKDKPYLVFHNSWQYLAEELGLQKPIVVDLHEGVSKGAKTVIEIRSKIKEEKIHCAFYDASVSQSRLKLLIEEANVKTEEIDVLGKGIEMNQSTYINWLRTLTKKVENCLTP